MFGSAALDLAWVAPGRLDGSVTLSNNTWDVTAGVITAREAGGVVVNHDGTRHHPDSQATSAAAAASLPPWSTSR